MAHDPPLRAAPGRAARAAQPGDLRRALHDVHASRTPCSASPGSSGAATGATSPSAPAAGRSGDRRRDGGRTEHRLQDGEQRQRLGSRAASPTTRQLTSQVHEHGAHAFIQLTHSGAMMLGNWSKQVAVAPSVSPDYFEAPQGDGRARHRRVDRLPRPVRAQRRRRRLRRDRDPERTRVPAPPVPLAEVQLPHRRVRRLAREPDAVRRGDRVGGARGRRRRGRRRASASSATTSRPMARVSPPTTAPR